MVRNRLEEQGDMDSDYEENFYCPGCAEPFISGTTICSLCGLQLNELPGIIEIGLSEKVEIQKKSINTQLIRGAKAAFGTKDSTEFENRLQRLKIDRKSTEEKYERDVLVRLKKLFQNIVINPDEKFTLLDDSIDQLTLVTISNQDGNLNAKFLHSPWEDFFDENRQRRLCQLLAGFKPPTEEWFNENITKRIEAKTQLIHTSKYRDASHSQTLDNFITKAFPGLHSEKLIYSSDRNLLELINTLCETAPLDKDIMVLSAKVDTEGNVTYEDVIIFPEKQFIEPDKAVTILVNSNTVSSKTSKLIFSKGTDKSTKNFYEYVLDVEPGTTKQFSIKIERRQIDSITVDDNKVKAVSGKLEKLVSVDVSRRCIEVFIVLDTIAHNEKEFKSRKAIVENLINETGKYNKQIDIIFHLYSYSCDFIPAYSRPKSWPGPLFTEFSGNGEETNQELHGLKMSGPGPHVFPGRLELVFKRISECNYDSKKTYFLFIIGNRPASPENDLPKVYGVSTNWKNEWEKIKTKFSFIQIIHDDNFAWAKESFPVYFKDYYESFWNTIQPDRRISNWSNEKPDQMVEKNLGAIANPNNELTIPSITDVKG